MAVSCENYELVKLLYNKGANFYSQDHQNFTPLRQAIEKSIKGGDIEMVHILLRTCTNANFKFQDGGLALNVAVTNGSYEIVKLLISKGANIDAKDKDNETPLTLTMKNKHWQIASLLIESGANVNIKKNMLHIAVFYEQIELVKLLIRNGARLNDFDYLKRTPLYKAIEMGNLEIVKILLENGADCLIKSLDKVSPFDKAKAMKNTDIILCIKRHLEKEVSKLTQMRSLSEPMNITIEDCIICYNQRSQIHVLNPCGHAKICEACCFRIIHLSESKSTCPVCRTNVIGYIKVFI